MNTDYKTVAVHVNESPHTLSRVKLASKWAVKFDTHLVGVAATGLPPSFYLGGLSGEGAAVVPAYIDALRDRAETALAMSEAVAAKDGVRSFEKRMIEEEPGVALCLQARYCDLLIIGQDDPDDQVMMQTKKVAEYVLLNSINQVLIVPHAGEFASVGQRVLIAWDGSMEAARAVHGAIPVLRRAGLVQVAVFDPKIGAGAHGEEPGADIALFLARHGVRVDVSRHATGNDIDVGNAILSHAADYGADLLVMGGYGHSRFREVMLGGVTRTVLQSMTMPVLMSH
ncbi:MAG TPA: universal stress protein [Paucimonas sp.]|nr:universal stress protein [Paucimonas sp.]